MFRTPTFFTSSAFYFKDFFTECKPSFVFQLLVIINSRMLNFSFLVALPLTNSTMCISSYLFQGFLWQS